MTKYNNKYRIESHRKPNWDYSANALYFITFNTKFHRRILGEIIDGKMTLSDYGKIVESEWHKSFEIRKELILHIVVIMPNHIHAILEISQLTGSQSEPDRPGSETNKKLLNQNPHDISKSSDSPNLNSDAEKNSELSAIKRNPPIRMPKSISSFIGGFKSSVNTKIDDYIDEHNLPIPKYNRNNHFFQPNYHDHIIRNHIEYRNIYNYIQNNPANWNTDKFKK